MIQFLIAYVPDILMNKKVVWSSEAINDFICISDFLKAHWETNVVITFIDLTQLCIQSISRFPRQYPVIEHRKKVRKCVVTKHNSIYYRDAGNQIHILRIFDTRQNPVKLSF